MNFDENTQNLLWDAYLARNQVAHNFKLNAEKKLAPLKTGKQQQLPSIERLEVQRKNLNQHCKQQAILASQRSIKKVSYQGNKQECCVVATKANGDCGFSAIAHYLGLYDDKQQAEIINREMFIILVRKYKEGIPNIQEQLSIANDQRKMLLESNIGNPEEIDSLTNTIESLEQEINIKNKLFTAIFKIDTADNIDDWEIKFKSSGYWLNKEHFELLSYEYNFVFHFYFLDGNHCFSPEIGNEKIYSGKDGNTATNIHLTHISTEDKNKSGASLNHFETLLISPSSEQKERANTLNSYNETQSEAKLLSNNVNYLQDPTVNMGLSE